MRVLAASLSAALAAVLGLGACNDVGDCPAASSITPGGSCSGDNLECPYTLDTPSPACDGTTVEGGLATSCVCTKATWACPAAVSCGAAPGDDAGGADGSDGAGDDSAVLPE
jgi:hypothetical protein